MKFTYRGCVAPVFTPFHNDENRSLNLSVISDYARFLSSKNINAVLINGSVGEGPSLSTDERKKVAEAWALSVKETKQHLMIQIGGTHLNAVKELAAHAESLAADSILCLPELYYKPSTIEELIQYLKTIALCAPKTPLLYYHVPQFSSVNISMEKFCKLIGDKIPTFAGIKFTSSDLEEGFKALKANDRLTIFLGNDMLVAAACTLGMDSLIIASLNILPESILELLEFGKGNRDLNSIKKTQDFIYNVLQKILSYGPLVETMKTAVNIITGISIGPTRASQQFITRESAVDMEESLSQFGIKTSNIASMKIF